jgi:hypothetical protein
MMKISIFKRISSLWPYLIEYRVDKIYSDLTLSKEDYDLMKRIINDKGLALLNLKYHSQFKSEVLFIKRLCQAVLTDEMIEVIEDIWSHRVF